jgi:hypothetical protein
VSNSITIGFTGFVEGITFRAGDGGGSASITIVSPSGGRLVARNCAFRLNGTGTSGRIAIHGATNTGYDMLWEDCSIQFNSTSQKLDMWNARWMWRGGSLTGATIPTTILDTQSATEGVRTIIEGVDFSGAGSGKTIVGAQLLSSYVLLKDCRTDSAVTIVATQTVPGAEVIVSRTGSSAINYGLSRYVNNGNITTQVAVRRNGGATQDDGTTVGWKVDSNADAKYLAPLELTPISTWNDTTGSSVTATIYGIIDAASMPTNAEVWMTIEYLSNASYPLGDYASTQPATILTTAAALTADTSDWDDGATARANTTDYSVGDIIKLASNAGRLFCCTADTGSSNGSEPAGYATAVDGDTVTDGSNDFRAMRRFKMTTTFTPQMAGRVFAYVYSGLASQPRLYIDPKIYLS